MSAKLKVLFLGAGSAFTVGHNNYQSNILLTLSESKLLIDCGSDIRFSLYEQGLNYNDIKDVYVSHLHADHVGGLEWLGFNRKFNADLPKPNLHISETLVHKLWRNVLSGSMTCLQGVKPTLEDYYHVMPIGKENKFDWEGVEFNLVRTIHTKNNRQLNYSYGLFFTYLNTSIFITTDTTFCPVEYNEFYQAADIIFHDCETAYYESGVHATYKQLNSLSSDIKSKMWLYHYNPVKLPDAVTDGFKGFVKKGQLFLITDE